MIASASTIVLPVKHIGPFGEPLLGKHPIFSCPILG
jgi:hypothetical protein